MTTYLKREQVPAHLREGYNGQSFEAEATTTVTIPRDAGLWSGGSRDVYRYIRLEDGKGAMAHNPNAAPWDAHRDRDFTATLVPGVAVVRHTWFCGKDHGLTFYVHPSDAAKLLPAPMVECTEDEMAVLVATRRYKSSYGGKDRRAMWNDDHAREPINVERWEHARGLLTAKGLLNKAGAITVAGRNRVSHII